MESVQLLCQSKFSKCQLANQNINSQFYVYDQLATHKGHSHFASMWVHNLSYVNADHVIIGSPSIKSEIITQIQWMQVRI